MTSDRPPVYVDELISNSMELPLMRYGALQELFDIISVLTYAHYPR